MTCARTARRPPERLRVKLDSLAFGGDAVGRDEGGRVVFVPGGAPGDVVEVEVVEAKKGFARARLARVLKPSPARVDPPCRFVAEGCGGCQWQHVAVDAQRAAKHDIVARALRPVVPEPIAAPTTSLAWRRRARLRWRGGQVGYAAHRSHRLVDIDSCLQLEAPLDAALQALRPWLIRLAGSGELELLLGAGDQVHAVVSSHDPVPDPDFDPGLAGLILRTASSERVLGAARIDLGDDPLPFWARADVFAQASAAGNAALRRLLLEAAGDLAGRTVLELHAGSGNFTRDLAARAARVVAVEESGPALALAAANLELRGLAAELIHGPATVGAGAYDLIVVDPPRTGLTPELAAELAHQPARVIYISCDPATLGRDIGLIGKPVIRTLPLDLMPQTFHVEILSVLG